MNEKEIKRISKFLSLILRHNPEKIHLTLDVNGWANVEELIKKSYKKVRFSMEELEHVVAFLYHGTVGKFMEAIREKGLQKMSRQHVHLSKDLDTAIKVGSRRGKPIILSVRAGDMYTKGYEFYCSENGVWLTDNVPVEFIDFKD